MVLNPELYAALKRLNKGRDPRISNAGLPAAFHLTEVNGKRGISGEGEHYAIDCVVCTDTRSRLYVHHCFGQRRHVPNFNQPGDQLLMLAYCQHCQKRINLQGYIEGYVKSARDSSAETLGFLNSGSSVAPPPKRACPPMGLTVPVHEMDPNDEVVKYLAGRGFNVEYLGKVAGAVAMLDHPDGIIASMTRGRIGFPFYVDGELKTWQARLAFDSKKKWPPKWWFPGQTSKVPWNVDVAAGFEVVILCEGILSAVNMGPAAVAVCGKTLTAESLEIVKKKWKRAFVALDPDCGINRKPGEQDFHERMLKLLRESGTEASCALWKPGDNRDPGDLSLQENIELIRRSDPVVAATLPYVGLP
jgi:hypothetical protein